MKIFGGTKLYYVMFVGVASVIPATALAVPVVPNFTQGSMTSHTETTSKVTETINSIDYNTGWQYSVTGTNVNNGEASLNPSNVSRNDKSTGWNRRTSVKHNFFGKLGCIKLQNYRSKGSIPVHSDLLLSLIHI